MKICIPTMGDAGWDEKIGEHFGRVPCYTIIDMDTHELKVIQNTSHHAGGQGYPPEIMAREGVHALLCRGLGKRAITMFAELDIAVFIGATGTVRDAVDAFTKGSLQKADISNACGQHSFRDQHHHEHGLQDSGE